MRLVVDTNTLVSGLLWGGKPGRLIRLARSRHIALLSSTTLLRELHGVLARRKFNAILTQNNTTWIEVYQSVVERCTLVSPAIIPPTIRRDPADDAVLAAAVGGSADLIVSGDADLLDIGQFRTIPILGAAQALAWIEEREKT